MHLGSHRWGPGPGSEPGPGPDSGLNSGPAGDSLWTTALRRWNVVCWVLLGAVSVSILLMDEQDGSRTWTLVLLATIVLCCAALGRYPDNRVLRPHTYLLVLVLCLTGVAYLRSGYAALYMVTLPHFWIYARTSRAAIGFTGAAAVLTVAVRVLRTGWGVELFLDTVVATFVVYAVSVLLGLWVHTMVEQSQERARLIVELELAQQELSEAQLRQGAAEERERIARDIHDTLAQGFASIVVLAEAAGAGLGTAPERSAQQLASIESTARENLAEARELVASAHRRSGGRAESVSVVPMLRRTLDRFAEDTGLRVRAELAEVGCEQSTRIALLRCVQESLANVRKHAAAEEVGMVLARHWDGVEPVGVELEITDDGRGFVVGESHGYGLDGMRKRIAELGGELTVTSSVGDGTRVLAVIPSGRNRSAG
jgi:signal transduction histidine kinase